MKSKFISFSSKGKQFRFNQMTNHSVCAARTRSWWSWKQNIVYMKCVLGYNSPKCKHIHPNNDIHFLIKRKKKRKKKKLKIKSILGVNRRLRLDTRECGWLISCVEFQCERLKGVSVIHTKYIIRYTDKHSLIAITCLVSASMLSICLQWMFEWWTKLVSK